MILLRTLTLTLCAAVASAALLPNSAIAQSKGFIPGVPDQNSGRDNNILREPGTPDPSGMLDMPAPTAPATGNGQVVVPNLRGVMFYGPTVVSKAELGKIVEPYLYKPMTSSDLAALKFNINKTFHERGYVLVRAVTIPQDVSQGVLRIDVHEGKIGAMEVVNNNAVADYIANSRIKTVEPGTVFNETDVESMVTDLDDLNGVSANLNLRPGQKFGTTELVVNIEEADEDVNYVSVDNYGSELTGEYVGSLHLEKSNLLHAGEKLYFDARHSDEELYSVSAGADIPTGLGNTVLELDALYSENEIGDRLAALNASGETVSGSAALSGKIVNTSRNTVTLRGGMQARQHKSFLAGTTATTDDIRTAFGQIEYTHRNTDTILYGSATVSRNLDIWGATDETDPLRSRLVGNNDTWALRPVLYMAHRPYTDGTVRVLATGQMASNAMLASDLFILGGYGSVRGFNLAQETGEAGWLYNAEFLHTFFRGEYLTIAAGPFSDGGMVYNRVDGVTQDSELYSAGIGLEATSGIFPIGETKLRVDWAHPLGDYTATTVEDDSFYARLTQEF